MAGAHSAVSCHWRLHSYSSRYRMTNLLVLWTSISLGWLAAL